MGLLMIFTVVSLLAIDHSADKRIEAVEKKAYSAMHNKTYHDAAVQEREALRKKLKENAKPLVKPINI